jgi:hypothetical protein
MTSLNVQDIVLNKHPDWMANDHQFDDIPSEGPIRSRLKVRMTGMGFRLEGQIAGTLTLACNRCSENFHQPIIIDVEEDFLVIPEEAELLQGQGSSQKEVPIESFGEVLNPRAELDLNDVIRQCVEIERDGHRHCFSELCQQQPAIYSIGA